MRVDGRHGSAREELRRRTLAHGPGVCRWCGGALSGGRRSWCSDACVEDYRMRTDAGFAAAKVLARDRGICAECGVDCVRLRGFLRAAMRHFVPMGASSETRSFGFWSAVSKEIREQLRAAGFSTYGDRRLWEADHVVPVVEGGGSCGLENLRTLCQRCHKRETARLAARRAANCRKGVCHEVSNDRERERDSSDVA